MRNSRFGGRVRYLGSAKPQPPAYLIVGIRIEVSTASLALFAAIRDSSILTATPLHCFVLIAPTALHARSI